LFGPVPPPSLRLFDCISGVMHRSLYTHHLTCGSYGGSRWQQGLMRRLPCALLPVAVRHAALHSVLQLCCNSRFFHSAGPGLQMPVRLLLCAIA
jgi:hypothetical protein